MRRSNKRHLALAFVLGLVLMGGSDGLVLDSLTGSGGVVTHHVGRDLGAVELAAKRATQRWAALAEATPGERVSDSVRALPDNAGARSGATSGGREELSILPALPLGDGDIPALISAFGWPQDQALSVLNCEGGETSVSSSGNRGYFQIGYVHLKRIHRLGYTWDDMLVAGPNIAVAADLHAEQGWSPWRWSHDCHGL